jgi:uncharacterized protein
VDPNVLVSAAISAHGPPARILEAWRSGFFEMVVSYELLHELEAVLLRDRFRRKLTVSDVLEYVLWLREQATLVVDPTVGLGGQVSRDPGDEYLVMLADGYRANYLVSGNRHLLDVVATGAVATPVVSPRQFMEELALRG